MDSGDPDPDSDVELASEEISDGVLEIPIGLPVTLPLAEVLGLSSGPTGAVSVKEGTEL